jgi:hypothetical protein
VSKKAFGKIMEGRLPHIGRNRPKKKPSQDPAPAPKEPERAVDDLNDSIPF